MCFLSQKNHPIEYFCADRSFFNSLLGELQRRSNGVLDQLNSSDLSNKTESVLGIPNPFRATGKIKLIILGQDPTVKRKESRYSINVVLNLDKPNALTRYIQHICQEFNVSFYSNLYATNCLKNFFIQPPASLGGQFLTKASKFWLPLLREELEEFPNIPIVSLGQPLLRVLSGNDADQLKQYWGYQSSSNKGDSKNFKYLDRNILDRPIFPFPHQPSIRKVFYTKTFRHYVAFVLEHMRAAG